MSLTTSMTRTLVKTALLVVAFVSLCSHAKSQIVVQPPPKPTVTTDIRFAPMVKAEVVHTPNGGAYVQQDSKPITCTFNPTSAISNYTILGYLWSGLDFGSPAPSAATVTGYAHGPGVYYPTCTVILIDSSPGAQPFFDGPFTSKPVYVVGGPLTLGVTGGVAGTPARDSGPISPVYVEYFGFDPASTPPVGAQNPQTGTVSACGGQPGTTTYSWNVPAPLEILSTGVGPTTSIIAVGATDGSAGAPIQVKLTYNFDNQDPNDEVTGTCLDDSPQQIAITGDSLLRAYRFDAHKPKTLAQVTVSSPYNVQTVPPNSSWGCGVDYTYQLKDDGAQNMGSVYIAERWEFNWGDAAIFLWNGTSPPATGLIVDSFSYYLSTPHPWNGGNGPPALGPFTHRYYAATTDTSYVKAGLSGILVLTTTTTFWTDKITNN